MKFSTLSLLILLIISSICYAQSGLNLYTPNGSENLSVGSQFKITWGNDEVTNIRIDYSTNGGTSWILVNQSISADLFEYNWTVPATISSTCKVRISDTADSTVNDLSDAVFAITKPTSPTLSLPADAAKSQPTSITLTWNPIPSASQYKVQVSETADFAIPVDYTVASSSTSKSLTALKNNQTYYWRLIGTVNVGGISRDSDPSTPRSFKTKLINQTLSAPINAAIGQSTSAALSWNSVTGANNYTLQVSTTNDFQSYTYNATDLTTTSKTMSALEYNTIYYWRVKATQTDGNESDYSETRSFKTIHQAPTLSSPLDNATNYGYVKVSYSWTTVLDATQYELKVSTDSSFPTTGSTKTYTSTTNSYTPAADLLTYGTTYYWKVNAKVGTISSDYSTTFSFTVGTPTSFNSDTTNVCLIFDHSKGSITSLRYKQGSNTQLLNAYLNNRNKTGLGRITNEDNSKLVSWIEASGTRTYTYENTLYGSKTLVIAWDANGVALDVTLNLDANKSAVTSPSWLPGGTTGPSHDYVLYANADDQLTKANLTYPGVASILYSGNTLLTAIYDDRSNEYFGYKSSAAVKTLLQQAISFGPSLTFDKSSTAQTINFGFAVKNKVNFFNWANKKYIIVSSPATFEKVLDDTTQTITWDSYGTTSNVDIKLSTDGGSTFPYTLVSGSANDGTEECELPDLSVGTSPLSNCKVQVSATGVAGASGTFTIVNSTTSKIVIAKSLTGSPSSKVDIPITISPGSGASVNALDIRLEYDKNLLTYDKATVDASLASWTVDVTNNNTNGYIQIGGFKSGGSAITTSSTLVTITFAIKSNVRVGTQTELKINNTKISLADDSAMPLLVAGQDGLLTFYSGVSGYLRYILNKRPIYAASAVKFEDSENSNIQNMTTTAAGKFEVTNVKPGSTVVLTPKETLGLPTPITDAVDAADARRAFDGREGGAVPFLSELQKIASDVNADGIVNSTDALAILKISTGTAPTSFASGTNNWIFVDSTFRLTSANWSTAPRTFTYSPLDTVKARQTFWGMIRGDADGDYMPSTTVALSKSSGVQILDPNATVAYSTPQMMTIKVGDTLALPIFVKLNGNKIGAFNASIMLNPEIFDYTEKYTIGSSIPSGSGWTVITKFENGKLNIGATDLMGILDPITVDGVLCVFKFVAKSSVKLGDGCDIDLQDISASDSKLMNVAVSGSGGKVLISSITSIETENMEYDYSLDQNYPNPFNPSTIISYSIKHEGMVVVDIYNILGERVFNLVNEIKSAGKYKVEWNAKDFASGMYFCRIKSGDFNQTRKMLLIK